MGQDRGGSCRSRMPFWIMSPTHSASHWSSSGLNQNVAQRAAETHFYLWQLDSTSLPQLFDVTYMCFKLFLHHSHIGIILFTCMYE